MARSKFQKTKDMPLSRLMALSRKDLIEAVDLLAREGNKRLTVMKKKGIASPSTSYIRRHGGKFSSKTRRGKERSVEELRAEFQRVKGFLDSKTSTISGYKAWEKNVAKTLLENTTIYQVDELGNKILDKNGKPIVITKGLDYNALTPTQKKRFWEAYAKIEELDEANVLKGSAKYRSTLNDIYERITTKGLLKRDIDSFANEINDKRYHETPKDFKGALNIGANGFTNDDNNESPFKS